MDFVGFFWRISGQLNTKPPADANFCQVITLKIFYGKFVFMAISREKYQNINHTLKGLRTQIIDSLDYCADSNFYYDNPRQMYYNILPLCKYQNDPPGVELIQTVPTLLNNNYHGMPGAGDCDCFTVLTCAIGCINNWKQRIVLCGRTKNGPVHIFSQVFWDGKWQTVDLTARLYNTHKKYNFYQYLDI